MTTTGEPGSSPHFDIRAFTRTAQGNFRSEIDLSTYETDPLDAQTLELVRYLSHVPYNCTVYALTGAWDRWEAIESAS